MNWSNSQNEGRHLKVCFYNNFETVNMSDGLIPLFDASLVIKKSIIKEFKEVDIITAAKRGFELGSALRS